MKQGCASAVGSLLSRSYHYQTQLQMRFSCWKTGTYTQISSCRLWCSSVPHPSLRLSYPRWKTLSLTEVISRPPGQDGIDPSLWRELLQPFTAVKNLYLFPGIAPRIALVLQELVGESVLEPFPVLQNIFLNELQPFGFVPEGIEQFVATRQLASHPISVSRWEIDSLRYYR
jgi:hypothetical protein